jgi:hypothetical protein
MLLPSFPIKQDTYPTSTSFTIDSVLDSSFYFRLGFFEYMRRVISLRSKVFLDLQLCKFSLRLSNLWWEFEIKEVIITLRSLIQGEALIKG